MQTVIKKFEDCVQDGSALPIGWGFRLIQNDDNLTYLLWNTNTGEAILVDPMREDFDETIKLVESLSKLGVNANAKVNFRVIAVIDTHTHADHISSAADLARHFHCPLIMHENAPTKRAHLMVRSDVSVPTQFGSYEMLVTPGHTHDGVTVFYGPFILTGDTIIYWDTGRDDLPTGNAEAHYDSLQKIKAHAKPEMIFLPGHDGKGRISSWVTQLKENPSLKQTRDQFVPEAAAYRGPSPKLLKESLFENFR